MLNDVGGELYRSWSEEQRRAEIGKLVEGYRSGLPVVILCMTAASIAGGDEEARAHLTALMTAEERKDAIAKAVAADKKVRALVKTFLGGN
jgi:membrane protein required for beta-lactamase induction